MKPDNSPKWLYIPIIGLLIVLFVAIYWTLNGGSFQSSPPDTRAPRVGVPTSSGVTMPKYEAIQSGMSYAQVKEIIGFPGTEMSRVDIPGVPTTVVYQWQNPDGSNMNATFQGDQLTVKAQAGLR